MVLHKPNLSWLPGDVPKSLIYDDFYYSPESGIRESDHVFLRGIDAPQIWLGANNFVIAETGFGTGLNFLCTWQQWMRTATSDQRLHFISIEAHPLAAEHLERALNRFPDIKPQANKLIAQYPPQHPGYHRLSFEGGRISLTLLFGNVEPMLRSLTVPVDAWYLDGFAPSVNPAMWTDRVFKEIAAKSHPGTRLATFTVAGNVRRGLEAVGFEISRREGIPPKAENLQATFQGPAAIDKTLPWHYLPLPVKQGNLRAAVIGGGIAGCATARALKNAGIEVTLIDRRAELADEASGNPVGFILPKLTLDVGVHGRFQSAAYLRAVDTLDALEEQGAPVWVGKRGALMLSETAADTRRNGRLIEKQTLPLDHLQMLNPSEATEQAGIDIGADALWFPKAGCVDPAVICRAVAEGIQSRLSTTVSSIESQDGKWHLKFESGQSDIFNIVVLAAGIGGSALSPGGPLPLDAMRGQITLAETGSKSQELKVPLAGSGYITPASTKDHSSQPFHVVGATFDPWPTGYANGEWEHPRDQDNQRNLESLSSYAPELAHDIPSEHLTGRSALRAMTNDHLPLVGGAIDHEWWIDNYTGLHHGPRHKKFPKAEYLSGLYICTGMGSHGFQGAFLSAQILTDMIKGTPPPIDRDILNALSPGRFAIRKVQRKD